MNKIRQDFFLIISISICDIFFYKEIVIVKI